MELTQQRGAIPLTLDRPRILFFDLAATFLLVEQYGMEFVSQLYTVRSTPRLIDVTRRDLADVPVAEKLPQTTLSLKDPDALRFFLWAGLQAELAGTGEDLTLEQAGDLVIPSTIRTIFYALVRALTASLTAPELVTGKAEAARPAAKRPAVRKPQALKTPSKTKASTLSKHSGSRSRR